MASLSEVISAGGSTKVLLHPRPNSKAPPQVHLVNRALISLCVMSLQKKVKITSKTALTH